MRCRGTYNTLLYFTYLDNGEFADGGVCGFPRAGPWFSTLRAAPILLVPALDGMPLVATGSSSAKIQRRRNIKKCVKLQKLIQSKVLSPWSVEPIRTSWNENKTSQIYLEKKNPYSIKKHSNQLTQHLKYDQSNGRCSLIRQQRHKFIEKSHIEAEPLSKAFCSPWNHS